MAKKTLKIAGADTKDQLEVLGVARSMEKRVLKHAGSGSVTVEITSDDTTGQATEIKFTFEAEKVEAPKTEPNAPAASPSVPIEPVIEPLNQPGKKAKS